MKIKSFKLLLRQTKEIFLPLLVLVTVLLLTNKFLLPKMIQAVKFHRRLKENEAQVLGLEKKAAFLEKQGKGTLFADFKKVKQVLPDEKDVAGILVALENLKQDSNLVFGNLDLRPGLLATSGARLKKEEFGFKIVVVGSYEDLISFLEKIKNAAPLTSVEEASLTFKPGENKVRANLLLKAYYLPLEKTPQKIERPLPSFSPSSQKTLESLLKFETFSYRTRLPEEAIGRENPFSY